MTLQTDRTDATRANFRWAIAIPLALVLAACNAGQPTSEQSAANEQSVVQGTVHVCTSCHGFHGRSVSPRFPNLAGQQKDYIAAQLKAFRDHTRADPHAHTYMWGMAATLTDPTIDGLADYFSSQKPAPGTTGDPTLIAEGGKIFKDGIPDRKVPACQSCHGKNGEGASIIPRLAGQHPGYIADQLDNFISKARANEIMHENSKNLTPEEIQQIATYVGSL
ncbi:MAG: cytochrome c4 [Alphaproteobacteria bacterium]|nr:cytochrome c4 [Alphaproteobacteria bacterium]